jgi:hypothetical protein
MKLKYSIYINKKYNTVKVFELFELHVLFVKHLWAYIPLWKGCYINVELIITRLITGVIRAPQCDQSVKIDTIRLIYIYLECMDPHENLTVDQCNFGLLCKRGITQLKPLDLVTWRSTHLHLVNIFKVIWKSMHSWQRYSLDKKYRYLTSVTLTFGRTDLGIVCDTSSKYG